jgi:hypothetical protein
MPSLSPSQSRDFFTMPFRKRKYTINPPDDIYNVIYLGNVLTIMGKGEQSIEKPLSLIWKAYCSKQQRHELSMKLMVTRSGLKAETKLQGLTEYWAHRITFCSAPADYPKVFCWVYKHDGKKMKPELRCHAVLCKKATIPAQIASNLNDFLHQALQEYKREKRCIEKARKVSAQAGGHGLGPRRKLLLQSGSLNFRPPVSRSKSAPRLGSIDEEDEIDETVCNEIIMEENDNDDDTFEDGEIGTESMTYDQNSMQHDFDSSADSSMIILPKSNTDEINNNYESDEEEEDNEFMRPIRFQRKCSMNSATKKRHQSLPHSAELLSTSFQDSCQIQDDNEEEEEPTASTTTDSTQIPTSSCASSDDGFTSSCQSGDMEQLHRNQRASLRRRIKALKEPDSISDESGYHESGAGSGSESKTTTSRHSIEYSDEDDEEEEDFEDERKAALAAQCLLGTSATIELEPNVQITAL